MASVPIATGGVEPISVVVLDAFGQPLVGLPDVQIKIHRVSDGKHYDWFDDTFKVPAGVGQLLQNLTEVSAVYWPGQYKLSSVAHPIGWDLGKITNPVVDDTYHVTAVQASGIAGNMPQVGEIKVGRWVDRIDVPVSEAATPAEVYAQTSQVIEDYRLHQLVLVDPGASPPTANSYVDQLLANQQAILLGGDVCTIKQSYAYDPAAGRLTGQVWVEKGNQVLLASTSAVVGWYSADGTELFTMSDAAPDTQGVFKVFKDAPGLSSNSSYYAVASVTVPGLGTITSAKGAFTIG